MKKDAILEALRTDYEEGRKTQREIAVAFGVTAGYVSELVKAARLEGAVTRNDQDAADLAALDDPTLQRAVEMRSRDVSYRVIAQELGITAAKARRLVMRYRRIRSNL